MLYARGASLSFECTDEPSSFSGAAWSSPSTVVSPKRTRRAALLAVGDPDPDPEAGDPLACLVLRALLRLLLLGMGATAAAPTLDDDDDDDRRSTILATVGAAAAAASDEQQHRYAHVAIQNAHGSATSASPVAGSHCGTSDGGSVT